MPDIFSDRQRSRQSWPPEVLQIFPKEISDPRRFSGRRDQLIAGTQLLLAGDHVFIYGSRGIGKSSLTKQLEVIAAGNAQLLKEIGSPLADEGFDFATCFITRDESINNLNQLLYRLTIDNTCFAKFEYLHELFGATPRYRDLPSLDPDRVSDFWKRATTIAQHHRNGLAIFVDEFELIRNHDGFSAFIKAGLPKVLFVVTGIANTEKELVRDHQSIERQLNTGKLPLEEMTEDELRTVVTKAEALVLNEIRFTEDAKRELVRVVRGQPYLLHLIGRQAFLAAFTAKNAEIGVDEIGAALAYVAQNKTDSGLESRYRKAIGHSTQREAVLRAFAETANPSAHTSRVYPVAEQHGVTNPSYYAANLQIEQFGQELIKVNDQTYAFRDRLFQAYVVATPVRLARADEREAVEPLKDESCTELLHFSDIHFGSSHFFTSLPASSDAIPAADKPSFAKYIASVIEAEKFSSAAVLVSGDVAQSGLTSEFRAATEALRSVTAALTRVQGRTINVLTCPGNHDVNWELIKSDPEARHLAFSPYVTFRNSVSTGSRIGSNIEPERLYEIIPIEGTPPVLVVSFNSATIEGPTDHRGYIGEGQLENALKEANAHPNWADSVRIAMFHHHLVSVSTIESRIASESLLTDAATVRRRLLKEGFSVVLHGHRHHAHAELTGDGTQSMVVIGCGSSGVKRDERGEQPLQFNRILVRGGPKVSTVQVLTYEFDVTDRNWIRSRSSPPRSFTVGT
jgi:3',5'-cyclic AMP phosphodiesterase CpdA